MVTYTVLADAREGEFQNIQELASIGGVVRNEVERYGGELIEGYAVLGRYDFQFVYEVDDEETAMKIAFAIERHGLDTETNQVVDIERIGEFVDDI